MKIYDTKMLNSNRLLKKYITKTRLKKLVTETKKPCQPKLFYQQFI